MKLNPVARRSARFELKSLSPEEIEKILVDFVSDRMKFAMDLPDPAPGPRLSRVDIAGRVLRKEMAVTNRLTREGVDHFYFLLNVTREVFVEGERAFEDTDDCEGHSLMYDEPGDYAMVADQLAFQSDDAHDWYGDDGEYRLGHDIEVVQALTGGDFRSVLRFLVIGLSNRPTRAELDRIGEVVPTQEWWYAVGVDEHEGIYRSLGEFYGLSENLLKPLWLASSRAPLGAKF